MACVQYHGNRGVWGSWYTPLTCWSGDLRPCSRQSKSAERRGRTAERSRNTCMQLSVGRHYLIRCIMERDGGWGSGHWDAHGARMDSWVRVHSNYVSNAPSHRLQRTFSLWSSSPALQFCYVHGYQMACARGIRNPSAKSDGASRNLALPVARGGQLVQPPRGFWSAAVNAAKRARASGQAIYRAAYVGQAGAGKHAVAIRRARFGR